MTKEEALLKYAEARDLMELRTPLRLSGFQQGQLAGVQQALAWVYLGYLDPIRAILNDEQLARAAVLKKEKSGD